MLRSWPRLRRRLARSAQEAGQALLFVLMAVALLVSVPLAIATTITNQLPETTRNLNWDAAYEAAQAGLNDYLQKLDLNGQTYSNYNSSNPDGNTAFTGWVQASTTPLEYYSYAPMVVAATGLISLVVSGKAGSGSGQVIRTFDYTVRPNTSLDDVYWSNYETISPDLGSTFSGCDVYYGQATVPSSCVVNFDTKDVLNGPVFSNDTFRMCGSSGTPVFESTVESGNIYSNTNWYSTCTGTNPDFEDGAPTGVSNTPPQNSIPPPDVTAAKADGCEFSGNVTLALSLSGSTTKISWSGGSLVSGSQSFCGSGSSGSFLLTSMTAGLIYAGGTISVSGSMTGGLDLIADQNINITGNITYPSGDIQTAANGTESDGTDALGLIALDFIGLYPPNNSGMTIDAAILSLTDSFYYPNWQSGSTEGTLNVFGSIAQDNRGPVATLNGSGDPTIGFAKNYVYDTSLQSLWPPYFVPPSSAAWQATTYSECKAGSTYDDLGTRACT